MDPQTLAWRATGARQAPRASGEPLYRLLLMAMQSGSHDRGSSRQVSARNLAFGVELLRLGRTVPAPLASLSNGLNLDFTRADLRIVADAFSHECPR